MDLVTDISNFDFWSTGPIRAADVRSLRGQPCQCQLRELHEEIYQSINCQMRKMRGLALLCIALCALSPFAAAVRTLQEVSPAWDALTAFLDSTLVPSMRCAQAPAV